MTPSLDPADRRCRAVRCAPSIAYLLLAFGTLAGAPWLRTHASAQGEPSGIVNWGRDRIDQSHGLDGRYTPAGTGKGVHIYVLDSGVTDRRGGKIFSEFADAAGRSRVVERLDFSGAGSVEDRDEKYRGHGTRVASMAAGRTMGVAPDAIVHSMRVSDSRSIVSAIAHIVKTAPGARGVINISFGPLYDPTGALQGAIQQAMDAGFPFTVSAGCRPDTAAAFGPFAEPAFQAQGLLIVGGTDRADRTFRNYGDQLTIYAPATQTASVSAFGEPSVPPLVNERPPEYCADSWAAPHAAGVAAAYLERRPEASPREVYRAIVSSAVRGIVTFDGQPVPGPSNRLLQVVRD